MNQVGPGYPLCLFVGRTDIRAMRFVQVITQNSLDQLIDLADGLTESPMNDIDIEPLVILVQ